MLDCIYIYQDNRWQHSFIYCNHLYVKKAHAIEPYIYYIIPKVRNKIWVHRNIFTIQNLDSTLDDGTIQYISNLTSAGSNHLLTLSVSQFKASHSGPRFLCESITREFPHFSCLYIYIYIYDRKMNTTWRTCNLNVRLASLTRRPTDAPSQLVLYTYNNWFTRFFLNFLIPPTDARHFL